MNNTILNSYSGIKTHQFGLDSISNNIANVNTIGYKESIPEFKTLLSQHLDSTSNTTVNSDMNYGSSVSSNAISTKNGNLKQSDGDFDMAYTGKGWFVVGKNQNGKIEIGGDGQGNQESYFTRDGSFSRDADGYLVTSGGMYVYGVDLGKIKGSVLTNETTEEEDMKALSKGELKPIQIPQDISYQPVETKKVDIALNLNATKNSVALDEFLLDENGKIKEDQLEKLDMNALFDSAKQSLDARVNNDIRIRIKTSEQSDPKEFVFKYGDRGVDNNEFRTFGDLKGLFKTKTGLDFDVARDSGGAVIKPMKFEIRQPNNSAPIHLDLGGKLANALGLNIIDLPMKPGDHQETDPIYLGAHTTNVAVFDKDGKKFILQTKYFLTQTADKTNKNGQHWETRSAIFDKDGKEMVSKNFVESTLDFDNNQAKAPTLELDFEDHKIAYSYVGAKDQKTTNFNYQDSNLLKTDTDGKPEGKFTDLKIDQDGIIRLHFDNGQDTAIGRIGIAAFVNDQGLRNVGGNLFEIAQSVGNDGAAKSLSGNAILGWDEKSKGHLKFGKILHHYLETSNTDVTNALTNLILMQRGYSMNAKAFSTGDDLMKEAINLKKS